MSNNKEEKIIILTSSEASKIVNVNTVTTWMKKLTKRNVKTTTVGGSHRAKRYINKKDIDDIVTGIHTVKEES